MDDVTRIEIPELMALGDHVTEIGARFGRAIDEIKTWRDVGAGAVDGSVTCRPQLELAADNWRSTLLLLANSIEDNGRSLHQAAADYWTADLGAEQRVRRAGGVEPR